MSKNFTRLYTKVSFLILAFLSFYPFFKVSAHNVTDDPWLYVNNTAITDEFENPVPNPSKFQWGEHVFSEDLKINDLLDIKIDRDVIARDLEVIKEDIKVTYEFTDPQNKKDTFNEDFSIQLNSTGNYFLDIEVTDSLSSRILITESLMVVTGEVFTPSEFLINNTQLDFSTTIPIFYIEDTYDLEFKVKNPNDKFNYSWDLGTSETKEGTTVLYSFDKAKIPVYVTLRTIDKDTKIFVDSFVRVDTKKENTYGIPKPAVKVPDNVSSIELPKLLIIIIPIVLIISGIIIYVKKRR